MQKEELIPASDFCSSHNLELSFIYSLQQYDLVQVTTIEEVSYIPAGELPQAERIVRLYSELGINIEGIDAIRHLLQRLEDMENEVSALRSKLSIYEEEKE